MTKSRGELAIVAFRPSEARCDPAGYPTRNLILGALWLALSLALPMVFHLAGAGSIFLPMHIPVFLAGFTTSPGMAMIVGALAPLLSAILTQMPPFSPPVAQAMVFELGAYGLVTSLVYRTTRRIYLSWLVAAVAGRLTSGLAGALLLPLLGFKGVPLLYPLTAGLVTGLPGLILQGALVPAVVYVVTRRTSERETAKAPAPGGEAR